MYFIYHPLNFNLVIKGCKIFIPPVCLNLETYLYMAILPSFPEVPDVGQFLGRKARAQELHYCLDPVGVLYLHIVMLGSGLQADWTVR